VDRSPTASRRANARLSVRYSLALAAVTVLVVLARATSAQAVSGYFCPPGSGGTGTIGLNAYGSPGNSDRCAHAYHNGVDLISYTNILTNVEKCAVLKPNSDGSGGNVGGLSAGCAPGTTTAVQFVPGLSGHATGINMGANYHTGFAGTLTY
jgi:hypothetical protein